MSLQPPPLPPGWTEHKAPTGHIYYFNKALNKSTYTRPAAPTPVEPVPAEPSQPQPQLQADAFIPSYSAGQFAGGYSATQFQPPPGQTFQNRDQRGPPPRQRRPDNDRPKHKYAIPGCAPWVLIKTKYGRRFVHNMETMESLWKFPEEVMKGVIEFDRREREKEERRVRGEPSDIEDEGDEQNELAASKEVKIVPVKQAEADGSDSEYEEVEVTDSEGEGEAGRDATEKAEDEPEEEDGPREFTEEDMLWQLEAMDQDQEGYGDEEGYYEEEPPLSEEDAKALFRDLLDDHRISPFTPWDRIVEEGTIVEDERYVALPNMKARRDCFDEWSRERIQLIKEQRDKQAKQDPKIPYFQLLDEHASPKLYWPEFKRKFRKESAMKDMKVNDRDKEKYYREHIKQLAMSKDTLKKDLSALLKSLPLSSLNKGTSLDALPSQLIADLRYISLPAKTRDPMIEAFISTLPPAPEGDSDAGADAVAKAEKKSERARREKALREREERVHEAKKRHDRDVRFGKERLREKEAELERAMRVGKDGLRGHFAEGKDEEMKDVDVDE